MFNCLAIDIGAGSGRILKGTFNNKRLTLEEVHRFNNEIQIIEGKYRWDIDVIFNDICEGLKKIKNDKIDSLGIDTWGVDFVLLDENGEMLEIPVAYRDTRTKGKIDSFLKRMDKEDIYSKTGIQFMEFNTLYQFMAMVDEESEILSKAKTFLMIPDFLNYKLTGKVSNEFTNMSTTQMMNAHNRTWDKDIINKLGINLDLFIKPSMPCSNLGTINYKLSKELNIPEIPVYTVASHDTGSAIAATPAKGDDWVYISSGTWCLMGVESETPITNSKAFNYNFTNEGGVNGTYRVLKNIMGLWIIRGIKKSFNNEFSFTELIKMGQDSQPFKHIIYVNDQRFTNPESMCSAIDSFCLDTNQLPPKTPGEYIRCAEEGLALLYKQVLNELKDIYQKPLNKLHILGGGVRDSLMCQLAADATGLETFAGPIEATAIGNLIVQGLALKKISTLCDARDIVCNSFNIQTYKPRVNLNWSNAYSKYLEIKGRVECQ